MIYIHVYQTLSNVFWMEWKVSVLSVWLSQTNKSTSSWHELIHMFLCFMTIAVNHWHCAYEIGICNVYGLNMRHPNTKIYCEAIIKQKNYIFCWMITSDPNSNCDVRSLIWFFNLLIARENYRHFMWTWWFMEYIETTFFFSLPFR